jgi:NADPH-dependent 2,4-dienoyl-CoA reductase/sulfur reductase-like enzyme
MKPISLMRLGDVNEITCSSKTPGTTLGIYKAPEHTADMGSLGTSMDSKPVGCYPPTGIDVLVVGTGLAGLTAAIECVRKGHNVRVLERNESINTAGTWLCCSPDHMIYILLNWT